MTEPVRNPQQTVISVSMSRSLLGQIDERAGALGMSRSQYLAQLARADLISRGELTLREAAPAYGKSSSVPPSEHADNPDKLKSVVFPAGAGAVHPESSESPATTHPVNPSARPVTGRKSRAKSPSSNPFSQAKAKA